MEPNQPPQFVWPTNWNFFFFRIFFFFWGGGGKSRRKCEKCRFGNGWFKVRFIECLRFHNKLEKRQKTILKTNKGKRKKKQNEIFPYCVHFPAFSHFRSTQMCCSVARLPPNRRWICHTHYLFGCAWFKSLPKIQREKHKQIIKMTKIRLKLKCGEMFW